MSVISGRGLLLTAFLAALATGCNASISNVTLPGGATDKDGFISKPTNDYTVNFTDALDLVPQASVKMNDVSIGEISGVKLVNGLAQVKIKVLKSVNVPANANAILSQTSLLGEKFVNLTIPNGAAVKGTMVVNSTIPTDKTSDEVQAEDVFGALSELLNGGGIQQLQTISLELTQALSGREGNVRDLLSQFTVLATSLDTHRTEIVHALDSVDGLAKTLVKQEGVIKEALTDIAPGLKAIDESRAGLKDLITALNKLGTIASDFEAKTVKSTVADLNSLAPTLNRLNQAGGDITSSLQLLLTFPFGDNALKAIFSDYTGLYATLNVDLRNGQPGNPLGPTGLCSTVSNSVADQSLCSVLGTIESAVPPDPSLPTSPTSPTLPGLPSLPPLPGATQKGATVTTGTTKKTAPATTGVVPGPAAPTGAPPTSGVVQSTVGTVVGGLTGGGK